MVHRYSTLVLCILATKDNLSFPVHSRILFGDCGFVPNFEKVVCHTSWGGVTGTFRTFPCTPAPKEGIVGCLPLARPPLITETPIDIIEEILLYLPGQHVLNLKRVLGMAGARTFD